MPTIKKVALVESKAIKTHIFSRKWSPRLGLPILSAVLKKHGYEVELFYQQLKPLDYGYLMTFDIVGVSALTSTVQDAYRIGDALQARGKAVIMGGPHVSAQTDEALAHCDYVVRGEGENTLLALLAAINEGQPLSGVPGISYRENGEVVQNPSSITKVDMTSLPSSDFSACKMLSDPKSHPGGIMFSRGCPFDCSFCSVTTTYGKKYRHKTTEQIIEELRPFTGRPVCFIDDNFAAVPKKTKELLRAMIKEKVIPSRYSCQIRASASADEELFDLMRQTGCHLAGVGLESVSPETLKAYHKGQTCDQIVASIKVFQKYNIGLHGMFVLGADNDTADTIHETVSFALEHGIDTIQICALTPLPGTAVHGQMVAEGRVLHKNWDLYDGLHVNVRPVKMTSYELQTGIIREMKRFYSLGNAFKIDVRKLWRFRNRLIGWYLVRRWEKENTGYCEYLAAQDRAPAMAANADAETALISTAE